MKKFLAVILAIAFAFGVVGGVQMVKADATTGNSNTGGGTNVNTNTGGSINSCGPNCTRLTWGQLKARYQGKIATVDLTPVVDNKNAE